MKIFVAIPSYEPKLQVEVVRALFDEQKIALGIGDDITMNIATGDAGIVGARNYLVSKFYETDFDTLFFLDGDVTWNPGDLVKLCHRGLDFIGGCYRHKMEKESYPVTWLDDQKGFKGIATSENTAILEVKRLPTGFLALSRNVFDTIMKHSPKRMYTHFDYPMFAFFQMAYVDNTLVGEDYLFCQEWENLGGKIYLDPEIQLTHWGINPVPHPGHIGNWLRNRPKEIKTEAML